METFENRLEKLDLSLFEKIPSETTPDDKRSLLAIQTATRDLCQDYVYLEIGSYLGGSIQSHILDQKCSKIYSLDKRPLVQHDERGLRYPYPQNSTKRMLELLSEVGPTEKITTIDGETRSIDKAQITGRPKLCLIDGEHTDITTNVDFDFCLDILDSSGAIIFHDSHVIYRAIQHCVDKLTVKNVSFRAYNLPSVIFVIEINDFPLHENPQIRQMLAENHKGYLYSLIQNDKYRRFTTSFPVRYLWKGLMKLGIEF